MKTIRNWFRLIYFIWIAQYNKSKLRRAHYKVLVLSRKSTEANGKLKQEMKRLESL